MVRINATGVVTLLAIVSAAAVLSLAMPVKVWRTGDQGLSPLVYSIPSGQTVSESKVWVDTDAACGQGPRTDPDDCLALAVLIRSPGVQVLGVSTVFGNADLDAVDATVEAMFRTLEGQGHTVPPIWRGAREAAPASTLPELMELMPAHRALIEALERGPMTIVALGPLTNVATVLAMRPDLASRISALVAVQGRRPGHLFHPSEGAGGASFLGHGPVFRDFNFALDPAATAALIATNVPLVLVPYDAARHSEVSASDVAQLGQAGPIGAWLGPRLKPWLVYWEESIGRTGFMPFDLMAVAPLVEPDALRCARVHAWVGQDDHLFLPGFRPTALLVAQASDAPAHDGLARVAHYCGHSDADLHRRLLLRLVSTAR